MLPLGSVVKLKNGEQKLMVISRLPLFNNGGTIGYFDYASCLYPLGQTGQQMFFFNEDDIEKVFFLGYTDSDEKDFQKTVEQTIDSIPYPKLQLQFEEDNNEKSL